MSAKGKCRPGKVGLQYLQQKRKRGLFLVLAVILLLVTALISLFLGSNDVGFPNLLATYFPKLGERLSAEPMTNIQSMVLWKLRLPRIVSAIVVGASLAVCGTIMQATTGNVMASPYTTGISSAAALGAAIGILFHPFGSNNTSTIICAFIVGMFDAAMVYGVTLAADLGAGGMILIGVALNFMFGAANSLLQYVANEDQLSQIVHWTFGSLTGIEWRSIIIMGVALTLALIVFMRNAWSLNIMASSGDESAKALGVNPNRVRVLTGFIVTVVAAIIISFVGVIGFVGLVAPHIARIVIGSEHRYLIPGSTLLGSLLVLIADTIGRTVVAPTIIPVGVVLSVVGAPLFVYLIITRSRRRSI